MFMQFICNFGMLVACLGIAGMLFAGMVVLGNAINNH